MARETDVWRVVTTRVIVQPGATLAQFITPVAGQLGIQIKPLVGSSGTLEVLGATYTGASGYMGMGAADLVSSTATGFVVDPSAASPPFRLGGPAYFSLAAIGATIVATLCKEIANGI